MTYLELRDYFYAEVDRIKSEISIEDYDWLLGLLRYGDEKFFYEQIHID